MQTALDLAAQAIGRTSPNPMVGAVLVKDGVIVGRGFHPQAGAPHAEIYALKEAGELARDACLYVTLEPCCHQGRTGPCTEAVLQAGVSRVVAAMADPNPLVAGKGLKYLKDAGLSVECGLLAQEARQLNEVFSKYIINRRPFIALKTAMTLDGKIATAKGASKWITGEKAREYTHRLRNKYDAILVGVGTVLADDPLLTCRLPENEGRDPVRIILDTYARTPTKAQVINRTSAAPTLIITGSKAPAQRVLELKRAGAEVITLADHEGAIDLSALLAELGRREITGVLVEGGALVNSSFVAQRLADKIYWFIAPKIIGGENAPTPVAGQGFATLEEALLIKDMKIHILGDDICVEGYRAE